MPAYVIKTWEVSEQKNESGNFIEIKGRAPGLISWLLSFVGIDATVALKVSENAIDFEQGSWGGRFYSKIPVTKVRSISYGYSKPWKAALSVTIIVGALFMALWGLGLILGPIAGAVYYYLNKSLMLGFHEGGGIERYFEIKRSVIEGKRLEEKDAEQVQEIIASLILKA